MSGCNSPIRFYRSASELKKSQEEKEEAGSSNLYEVDIPVKIDPTGGNERANTTKEKFHRLLTFADAGEELVELRRDLEIKLYSPMGQVGPTKLVGRLRYLSMVLGTTARQQLSKAVRQSFVNVSTDLDATMTDNEREDNSKDEKKIYGWLAKPRQSLWQGLSDDEKNQAISRANKQMEDQVWFYLYRLAYPETHSEALTKFDTYITTQIVKPAAWTITRTCERVEEMYEMRKFLSPTR